MRALLLALLICVGPATLWAQSDVPSSATADPPDFSGLGVGMNDIVYVTDETGTTVRGPVKAISPLSLVLEVHRFVDGSPGLSIAPRMFTPSTAVRIERRGDPVWDGALRGLLVGAGLAWVIPPGIGECLRHHPWWKCSVAAGITPALIGTLLDSMHTGRTRVHVAATRRAVAVGVRVR